MHSPESGTSRLADADECPLTQGFDLLLGSDVAYSLKALPSLFAAAAKLLSKKSGSVFLLGYVSR